MSSPGPVIEFGGSATFNRSAFRMRGGVLRLAKATAPLGFVWTWPGIDVASLDPTSVTVSRDAAGRWFVVLHVDVPSSGAAARYRAGWQAWTWA